jgi:UDP-N-acetylglucosamine--N-acetylmuramyl-(pentapeptide) pyrophosphoryl-undecaprenol N-acetylglucosamine transferase
VTASPSSNRGIALVSAGGTGGHLFPAEALAAELRDRGWEVHLATDHRVETLGRGFPAEGVHIVPSATLAGSNPLAFAQSVWRLMSGFRTALGLIGRVKPRVAIGFGGYPSIPPMLAARGRGVPTIVHEQNAVLGRANKFLAPRVTAIAASVEELTLGEGLQAKVTVTGNPVRKSVLEAAARPYSALAADAPVNLLVFGGSQGARFLSEAVPAAIAKLEPALRERLRIVQQCRPEDLEGVRATYDKLGVHAELAPFFRDLPARIAASHLVVSRSGASTAAELAVIGRPAILIPLPHALDQDQLANAKVLAKAGGAWLIPQAELSAERLAAELSTLLADPARLAAAAAGAKTVGRPDAVQRLADLAERVAANRLEQDRAA